MIRFASADSKLNIDTHGPKIRERLAHGEPLASVTLTRNIRCSKLVIANVPCLDPVNMDRTTPITEVIEELKKDHLYSGLAIVQKPRWTSTDLTGKAYGSISFVFEDHDGSEADRLLSSVLYVFGHRCTIRAWKDKIELPQCMRCWGYGEIHTSCGSSCRLCGSTEHIEPEHPTHCRECVRAGITTTAGCTHHSCPRCKQNHVADDPRCPSQRVAVERIRMQNALRVNAQTNPNPSNLSTLRRATGNRFI